MILCPFLTKRIPEAIWKDKSRICLIVHPGIHGDRGASSIDWALKERASEWGVTVLQADEGKFCAVCAVGKPSGLCVAERKVSHFLMCYFPRPCCSEMDAGAIWSTKNVAVPANATKSSLYSGVLADAAMEALHETFAKICLQKQGTPLDYSDPNVKGRLRDNMKIKDRAINFDQDAARVAAAIRVSDSSPGAPHVLDGHKVFLYGAHVDEEVATKTTASQPGSIVGKRNGAVLIACAQGAVWVSHMKGRGKDSTLARIKLAAADVLPTKLVHTVPELPEGERTFSEGESIPSGFRDMWATISQDGCAFLYFPFLNGAMSTDQCIRLTSFFNELEAMESVKVVVLAGGPSNWSNGINLNTIEASEDPSKESWENINAINDFVKAVFSSDKVTVAALQGNAGAGGAMAALACDLVWAHEQTVFNPHYKSMGLFGSEYWTHFLPQRVGSKMAKSLTENCLPVSAKRAKMIGMVDCVLTDQRDLFLEEARVQGNMLASNENGSLAKIQEEKKLERTPQWYASVEKARDHELGTMLDNFDNQEYIRARQNFVHKKSPLATSSHLSLQAYRSPRQEPAFPRARSMNGNVASKLWKAGLKQKVDSIKTSHDGKVPKCAVVIVSGNPDSERYVSRKIKASEGIGIEAQVYRFDEIDCSSGYLEDQLIACIEVLNQDTATNGIMVQLPLPAGVNQYRVMDAICPQKDVDGFGAGNLAGLDVFGGHKHKPVAAFTPCTAKGVMTLLDHYGVSVAGKHVCVVGRSCLVGLPTQLCLMGRGATVTGCDINTVDLRDKVLAADIVVASAGSPNLIQADWIKPGAVVVDVGFHVVEEYDESGKRVEHIQGDVAKEARQVASLMTPVPGGVGPMTVAGLLENTVDAFLLQQQTSS